MINLRTVYKRAEEHMGVITTLLFVLLGVLILLQSVFSVEFVFTLLVGAVLSAMTLVKPHWTLGLLAVYLPFESFFLKFVPDDTYLLARYGSEILIYVIAFAVLVRILAGIQKYKPTPFDLPFFLFVLVLLGSAVINFIEPTTLVLGVRQIIRFMLVFFLAIQVAPTKAFVWKLMWIMFIVVGIQSLIGVMQAIIGEPLDLLLLPSEERNFGTITLTSGVEQFWDPGSRVFATLGRYDRLGNFLYMMLALATGVLFTKKWYERHPWIVFVFLAAVPTLVLTYSRSSWFAFLLGFVFIGLLLKKDRRVLAGVAAFVIMVSTALIGSGLNVSLITESPGQTLTERFYESFSLARYRGEYYGLGRVFWYVHTVTDVVPAAPILGHGPGMFGAGAAAALHNTKVYENLGLPYGVFGTEGFIDNNWFSLWGEAGTLGMIFYLWLFLGIFTMALRTARTHKDPFTRALALGVCAMAIGIAFNAFTSTVFEIRTTAYYFWLFAGCLYVLSQQPAQTRKKRT